MSFTHPTLPCEPRSPQGCRVGTAGGQGVQFILLEVPAGQPQRKSRGIPRKRSKVPAWLE